MLAEYIRRDPLLSPFFEPFIFEEVPANTLSPGAVYIKELQDSDIYLCIIGQEYGYEDHQGVSPTEREYDEAKKSDIPRWVYIKDSAGHTRHPKETAFIIKIEQDVSRKIFADADSLKEAVFDSFVLFLKQQGKIESHDFDDSVHPSATVKDIDVEKIKDFVLTARSKRGFPLKETAPLEKILKHLNMIRDEGIVNSSLLAFSDNPQKFFPWATIKCAHFHGIEIEKPIPDYKEFTGDVFDMAEEAVDFVMSKMSLSSGTREKNNRVETIYEVPRAVIAEVIINAVAHRDYNSKGSIQVSVFNNRIEVTNPGGLPAELNLEDLKVAHSSYPRNPLLAGCMFLTGDIERYGTGMLEIYSLTAKSGLSAPVISSNREFKITIWRLSAVHETTHDAVHHPIHHQKLLGVIDDLSHRLVVFISGEMGRGEIMEAMELKNRANFAKNYLEPALSKGYIEMTIPESPTSKKQKYRLTKKGEKLKKEVLDERK